MLFVTAVQVAQHGKVTFHGPAKTSDMTKAAGYSSRVADRVPEVQFGRLSSPRVARLRGLTRSSWVGLGVA